MRASCNTFMTSFSANACALAALITSNFLCARFIREVEREMKFSCVSPCGLLYRSLIRILYADVRGES